MTRILLDQNVPLGLRRHLPGIVSTAYEQGWHELQNGDLLASAESAGFDIFLTCGRNIKHQQNLAGREIAIIVLMTNHQDTVLASLASILHSLSIAEPGSYREVLMQAKH